MNPSWTPSTCWAVVDNDALVWEHLEEESVLFDRRSGQTHLLTKTTIKCLVALQENAYSLDQLYERFELRSDSETAYEARLHISQLLSTLNELGLIASVPE